jgi:NAD+ kinase
MKIGIYTNLTKDVGLEITKELVKKLEENKMDYYLFENLSGEIIGKKYFSSRDYLMLDVMITVGGDGTVLNIAKDCIKGDIPMITINKGRKGFLNEIRLSELDRVIDILNGDYKTDRRSLISIKVGKQKYHALNEFYITRSVAKMINLNISINGMLIDNHSCDGLIISTPTGSTAYSLSAGGPIISPHAAVICITPVCSHSMHSRPIVVGDGEIIEISLADYCDDAVVVVDGSEVVAFSNSTTVKTQKSNKKISFWRLKDSSFYSKLLDRITGLI